ncbi:carboxymuconolactone decarboxylase family protein [Methanosalsum natronophilum]|uniref:Carboxymuconolactone decarboxylase family protein n=1 Tax=Methanosalsum natronophilum TaxID=768733 RepID=A0A424Z4I5_9EURY|nr:carboxymuconolactone decarboxylase family protein [Methanosalsum natronophilum]MCS3924022.1 AhpD family alkylhydroperoxidase [Methanosalsum natronophilum]RQD92374.1 MAG: carboxymuconolactone decarboxylase family protein [Methanosalsum natronophilum]
MEINKISAILGEKPEVTASKLLEDVEKYYGEIPYILNFMKDQPEILIPKILYDNSIMREFKNIDPKTVEMICIGVSAALKCEHCLKMHIKTAKKLGVEKNEIFDAILIAGTLSNAAVLAEGTRSIDSVLNSEDDNSCDDTCEVCNISESNFKKS